MPSGVDFVDYMREELTGAQLVLQLITPSFFESAFCLCELGAQWGMGLPCFPLVVPPVVYTHLKVSSARSRQPRPISQRHSMSSTIARGPPSSSIPQRASGHRTATVS